jgi:hypothetical protein
MKITLRGGAPGPPSGKGRPVRLAVRASQGSGARRARAMAIFARRGEPARPKFANLDGTLNFVETGNMDAKMIREILRDIA